MSLKEVRKKSLKEDNDIFSYPLRYISTIITMILVKTRVTPLQVTITHIIIGIIAAISFSLGSYRWIIIASILYLISVILDMVDGEIARYKGIRSEISVWIDHVSDNFLLFLIITGIVTGEFVTKNDSFILILGIISILITATAGVINISKRANEKIIQKKTIRLPIKFKYSKKVHVGIFVFSSLILIIGSLIKEVKIMLIVYIIINFLAMVIAFIRRINLIKKEFDE